MSIKPPAGYERAYELAMELVQAIDDENEELYDSLIVKLKAFYDEQTRLKRSHPFLTETMADYTEDAEEAVNLYKLSLEQAKKFPEERTYTKLICLAERLIEMGLLDQATPYLHQGREEAVKCEDEDYVEEADELLEELDY